MKGKKKEGHLPKYGKMQATTYTYAAPKAMVGEVYPHNTYPS